MQEKDPLSVRERIIRIKLVDGSLVNGQVNIQRNTGYERLSDLISSSTEPFLILFNVTLYDANGDNPVKTQSLFVNKNHIIWAEPDEEQK